jgi:purine-binding chemotaxis protein CheW
MNIATRDKQTVNADLDGLAGKYLTFLLGGASYGIAVRRVREIIKVLPITPVPQTPPSVKGIINLRGKVIPVVDLSVKFGVPSAPHTDRTCIVVVEVMVKSGKLPIGIIVDTVSDVTPIGAEALEPAPDFGDQLGGRYITALAKTEGGVKVLLNLDDVLADSADSQRRSSWSAVTA